MHLLKYLFYLSFLLISTLLSYESCSTPNFKKLRTKLTGKLPDEPGNPQNAMSIWWRCFDAATCTTTCRESSSETGNPCINGEITEITPTPFGDNLTACEKRIIDYPAGADAYNGGSSIEWILSTCTSRVFLYYISFIDLDQSDQLTARNDQSSANAEIFSFQSNSLNNIDPPLIYRGSFARNILSFQATQKRNPVSKLGFVLSYLTVSAASVTLSTPKIGTSNANNSPSTLTTADPALSQKYFLTFTSQSWDDSMEVCASSGGQMAMPKTRAEDAYIKGLISSAGLSSAWIGLKAKVIREGTDWRWIDGRPMDPQATPWLDQPYGPTGTEQCAAAHLEKDLKLVPISCSYTLALTICQGGNTPSTYSYFYSLLPRTYEAANVMCKYNNRYLLTVKSMNDFPQQIISNALAASRQFDVLRLGLTANATWYKQWRWLDGSDFAVNSTFWHTSQPSGDGNCACYAKPSGPILGFNDQSCSLNEVAVCERTGRVTQAISTVIVRSTTLPTNPFFLTSSAQSWNDSIAACSNAGGRLALLTSLTALNFAKAKMASIGVQTAWIGLRLNVTKIGSEGWSWGDGSPLNTRFLPWLDDLPYGATGLEQCAVVALQQNFRLKPFMCSGSADVACQFGSEAGGYAYQSAGVAISQLGAADLCRGFGARVPIIGSVREARAAAAVLPNSTVMWLDLKTPTTWIKTWLWLDGSPMPITSKEWYPDEPSNKGECGSIREGQALQDASCSNLDVALCEYL